MLFFLFLVGPLTDERHIPLLEKKQYGTISDIYYSGNDILILFIYFLHFISYREEKKCLHSTGTMILFSGFGQWK